MKQLRNIFSCSRALGPLLAFFVAACTTAPPPVAPPATVAYADLFKTFLEKSCDNNSKCPELFYGNAHFSSAAGCMALTEVNDNDPKERAAVEAGRIVYDGVKAAECLSALFASCDVMFADKTPAVCDTFLVGTIADAAACTVDRECKSKYCQHSLDNAECPGVCATPSPIGADCAVQAACEAGLRCIAKKCAPRNVAVDAKCDLGQDCADGLVCIFDKAGGTCKSRSDMGGPCKELIQCKYGLYCQHAAKGASKCAATAKAAETCAGAKPGEPLSDGGPCGAGLGCVDDGAGKFRCVALVKEGQVCKTSAQCDGLDLACLPGGVAPSTCQIVSAVGGPCAEPSADHPWVCTSPNLCVNHKCAAPGDKDAACQPGYPSPCKAGLECNGDKCTPLPSMGQVCSGKCGDGSSCTFDGTNQVCKAPVCK